MHAQNRKNVFQRLLKYLFYACLLFLTMGQLMTLSRGLNTGSSNIYVFDFAMALFVVVGVVYFLATKSFKLPKKFLFWGLFTFTALLSLVPNIFTLSSADFLTSFMYFLRWSVYLLAGVVVFNMLDKKILLVDELVGAVLSSGFLLSILGFVQLVVLPDFTVLDASLGWDPHKNRLASTFFDPNFAGAYLNICIALALWKFFYSAKRKFVWWQVLCGLVVPLLAVVLTFSRSAWLMLSIIIFVFGILKTRWLILVMFLGLFLAYFAVPRIQTRITGITDPADSAHFRLVSWGNAWTIAKDHLFLGVGFNTYRFAQQKYGFFDAGSLGGNSGGGADSSLLFVLATTGVVGLVFYLGGFLQAITGRKNGFWLVSTAVVAGLMADSLFINSLFYPQILFLLLIVVFV